jgi:phage gpG-like protein
MLELKLGYSWNYQGRRGGETLFHTAIGNLATELRDWSPAFRLIAHDVLEYYTLEMFRTAGRGEWQTLAPSTFKRKGNPAILRETGALEASFTEAGAGHVEEITREKLIWGSLVPYALFHQTGTGKGFQKPAVAVGPGTGRGMPMRKILALTDAMKRKMRSALVGRLAQLARQTGFAVAQAADAAVDPLRARMIGQEMLGL